MDGYIESTPVQNSYQPETPVPSNRAPPPITVEERCIFRARLLEAFLREAFIRQFRESSLEIQQVVPWSGNVRAAEMLFTEEARDRIEMQAALIQARAGIGRESPPLTYTWQRPDGSRVERSAVIPFQVFRDGRFDQLANRVFTECRPYLPRRTRFRPSTANARRDHVAAELAEMLAEAASRGMIPITAFRAFCATGDLATRIFTTGAIREEDLLQIRRMIAPAELPPTTTGEPLPVEWEALFFRTQFILVSDERYAGWFPILQERGRW